MHGNRTLILQTIIHLLCHKRVIIIIHGRKTINFIIIISSNKQYTWNPNNNIINKNAFSLGINKDKKSNWETNKNNSSIEDQKDQKIMNLKL